MMPVFCCVCVLSVCYILSTESVPIPENVSVKSQDMGFVLEWDPPRNATNTVFNYTAEVKRWNDEYEPVCVRSSSLSCDFTDHISIFGSYRLRVRTELQEDASDWVGTEDFKVDLITEISAPRVELTSTKGQTEVDITDPPMRKTHLRGVFTHISYLIHFWKKGEAKKEKLIRDQTRVMLPDLEPLITYCVEVAVLCLDYNKTSQFSNTTCVTNTHSGEVEPWLIAVVLLGSILVVGGAVVLIFLAVWYGYKACRFIFPDPKLTENLKQLLSQKPQSPILSAMQESTQPKELFHELRIFQQTEGPSGIQTDEDECCIGADIKQSSEEKSETASSTSEEEHLLAELRLL